MLSRKIVATIILTVIVLSGALPLTGLSHPQAAPSNPAQASTVGNATYPVTFTESGLNPGTMWSLNITTMEWNGYGWQFGGYNVSSTRNNSLTVSLVPGSYSYTAYALPGPMMFEYSGYLLNVSSSGQVGVYFTSDWKVSLDETGLIPGTLWNVTIRSINDMILWDGSGNKTTVPVWLSPGEYSYAASAIGYVASLGRIDVINNTVSETITFSRLAYYDLNITEVGIPEGVTSYIDISNGSGSTAWRPVFVGTINNATNVSVFAAVFFDGKYNFSIIAPYGYLITGAEEFVYNLTSLSTHTFYFLPKTTFNGSFTFNSFGNYTNYQHGNFSGNGSAVHIIVFFAPATSHPTPYPFPWWIVLLIVVIAVILVLIPVVAYARRRRRKASGKMEGED